MADSDSSGQLDFGSSAAPFHIFPLNHPMSIKLSEENYLVWKQHVLSAVRGYGLEGYLTGEQTPPPRMTTPTNPNSEASEAVPNPAFTSWNMQDQRLSHWLQSSLSESTMVIVVGLSSSKDIWEALESNFSSQSKAKIMQYKLQLQTIKKDGLSMRAYLNKVKNYCDLLGAAGCRVLQDDHIMHILSGLGSEYHPVIVAITSRAEACSIQEATSILLSFETVLEDGNSNGGNSNGSVPTANLAQSVNQRKDFSNRDDGARNYSNRNEGGRSFNFRGRGGRNGRGGRSGGNSKLTCQLCQKPGHAADKCWYRYDNAPTPPAFQPRTQAQQLHFSNAPAANVAHTRGHQAFHSNSSHHVPSEYGADSSTSSWYPDSGATNHISNDFSNVNVAAEYNGGIQGSNSQGHT